MAAETETWPLVSAPAEVWTEMVGVETLASTCREPDELPPVFTDAEPAGVEALPEAVVLPGVELALTCVEAAGVDVLVLVKAAGGAGCDGGADWTLVVAEADPAGALTLTLTLAEGAGAVLALVPADTETGVGGPVNPSAFAGAAKDRLQRATATTIQIERRKAGFRTMIVSSLFG